MKPDGKTDGLHLDAISFGLAGRTLLSLSAKIRLGEILTIMGPSGLGKSALLAYLGGFPEPTFQGKCVLLGGRDLTFLPAEKRRAGILFQEPLLFPRLSVGGNLLFGRTASIRKRDQGWRMAEQALADVDLERLFDRDPATLSGGQKARGALQRMMLSAPHFLLLDEPFSKLDTGLREQTRRLVFAKAKAAGLPIVSGTHDDPSAGGRVVTIGEEANP